VATLRLDVSTTWFASRRSFEYSADFLRSHNYVYCTEHTPMLAQVRLALRQNAAACHQGNQGNSVQIDRHEKLRRLVAHASTMQRIHDNSALYLHDKLIMLFKELRLVSYG
jgi:hypothetical protein